MTAKKTTTAKKATKTTEAFSADEQIEKVTKGFEEVAEFGQKNVDALVKSSEVAAKVAEDLGEEVAAFSKKSFEESVAAAKELASAKTATEVFEKQSAFVTAAFEGYVAQATKMNEVMAAGAKDIFAPLNARFNEATESFKSFSV